METKIEKYLRQLNIEAELIADRVWLINQEDRGYFNIRLFLDDNIIIVRVDVCPIPTQNKEAFFKKALELNGVDIPYGAYSIIDNNLVLLNTLTASTLDLEELEGTLESFAMALASHYPILKSFF